MKKILFVPFVLFATALFAQQGNPMPRYMSHDSSMFLSGTRLIGFSYHEFKGLNARLKSMPQYEELRNGMGTLGIGSTHKIGHFVSQGGIVLGYGRKGDGDKKSSALGLLGASMDIGYNFFGPTSRLELFPTAGLGFEGYKAWIKRDLSAIPFDSVLQYPSTLATTRSVSFTNYFLTYRFGLNFGYSSSNKMFTIGLQAGYAGSFKEKTWNINDSQDLLNAPSDKVSRFYGNLYLAKRINWKNKGMGMHHM